MWFCIFKIMVARNRSNSCFQHWFEGPESATIQPARPKLSTLISQKGPVQFSYNWYFHNPHILSIHAIPLIVLGSQCSLFQAVWSPCNVHVVTSVDSWMWKCIPELLQQQQQLRQQQQQLPFRNHLQSPTIASSSNSSSSSSSSSVANNRMKVASHGLPKLDLPIEVSVRHMYRGIRNPGVRQSLRFFSADS